MDHHDRPAHGDYPNATPAPAITGYRQLSAAELDQINGLKALGAEIDYALKRIAADNQRAIEAATDAYGQLCDDACRRASFGNPGVPPPAVPWELVPTDLRAAHAAANESNRCLALARTNLQQGLMWAVRGVAKPEGF